ncbi:MAG TPA: GAF and ANTAR domain-containing protein [Nocardioidaceae bacterium]|nr:GAF and ANTAR domain-containing protein [Nocardioidaceae bacterium]
MVPDKPSDVAAALAAAARTISAPKSLAETLDSIVHVARNTIPGVEQISISVTHRNKKIETMAGTGELVWRMDQAQYEFGEGPCLDAVRTEATVVAAEHLSRDQRWPQYVPVAVKAGVRAQMGLQLYADETIGGLNLYSTASDTFTPDTRSVAELFATHAALVLGKARIEEQLNEALTTRKVIGQATGIAMARFGIDEDLAFGYLIRVSQDGNIKLRRVAEQIVAHANEEGRRER